MGFLDYRPDFAAGVSQNTGKPVLWICTGNRNGIICDTIYDGTVFPILIRYRVFAYLYTEVHIKCTLNVHRRRSLEL